MTAAVDSGKPKRKVTVARALTLTLLLVLAIGVAIYFRPLWVWNHLTRAWLFANGVSGEYVQLGPYRIHYFVGGRGRPLVLVHGLGGNAQDWAPLIPALVRQGFRVYALDLLGYGRSDRPDVSYSIALETEVFHQFLDSLHLQRPDLGGWSMGGWIVLKHTLDYPERARRVFVTDSAGIRFKPSWNISLFSAATPQQVDQFMAILTPRPPHIPLFIARDLIREMAKESWIVRRAYAAMSAGGDLLDGRLHNIRQPVLILWGKEDATIPLDCGEEMHREMPQSRLAVFDGCGHLTPVVCRHRILPEVVRFLEANPPLPGREQEFAAPPIQRKGWLRPFILYRALPKWLGFP
jgi:pimeloyl-ACP methyl ester carboxylesterase